MKVGCSFLRGGRMPRRLTERTGVRHGGILRPSVEQLPLRRETRLMKHRLQFKTGRAERFKTVLLSVFVG